MTWPHPSADAVWTVLVAVVCNTGCAVLGCYLVLRRLSLLGDAISHAVLPGIALAFLLTGRVNGLPVVLGAGLLGVLTSVLTESVRRLGRVPEDSSMGVVFTTLFALGVILISANGHADLDPGCVLYGLLDFVALDTVPVLGWEVPRALLTLGPVLACTLAFVLLFWKELKLVSFDPALATAMGFHAALLHYLLMGLVAGVTVASFEAVGSILVVAMLIVPAACAHLLADRLAPMMAWAVLVGAISAVLGYAAASRWNTSTAGMMAVVAGGQLALAVLLAPRHGLLSRAVRNARLALRIAGEDVLARLYRAEEAGGEGWPPRVLAWLAVPGLWRRGEVRPGSVRLTAAGRERARSLVRAHRLWEAYLGEHLGLPPDHLHEPAERMEHFLPPGLQDELASDLGGPRLDPHGRAIPPRGEG